MVIITVLFLGDKLNDWFQSLKGISGYYNERRKIGVVCIDRFQSLKGISGYYNLVVYFVQLTDFFVSIPERD